MRPMIRALCLAAATVLTAGPLAVTAATPAAAAPGVDPSNVELTLGPGESTTLATTVETPPIAPNPDIVFLADTTGSMQPALANVSQNIRRIMSEVKAAQPGAQFAVAEYKEQRNTRAFHINTPLTTDENQVASGVNDWLINVGGGGAPWTDFINAHYRIGTDAINFRPNSARIVAWFGDARSHDPSLGHTQQDAIGALQSHGVRVVAVPLDGGVGGGLDALGQASALTSGTGGVLRSPTASNAVAQSLLDGIRALEQTVKPVVTTCDAALAVTFSPVSRRVKSGTDAQFDETIALRADAAAGTHTCTVDYQANGLSVGYTQAITVTAAGGALPNVRIGDASTPEGNTGTTPLTFTVGLDAPSTNPVRVQWSTAPGTAGADDFDTASGEVTFAPGETSKLLTVSIHGDRIPETDETFAVVIQADGAVVLDGHGEGGIEDDDASQPGPVPTLRIGDVTQAEGNSGSAPATVTVVLDQASNEPIGVHWATANGSAAAPGDFTARADDLTFPPGETTAQITVPILGDTAAEGDESFTVTLSNPLNATISDDSGLFVIVDDDGGVPPPALSVGDVSVAEGQTGTSPATFTVSLSRAHTSSVSVHYATANGTASAPSDFTAVTGDLTFAAGEVSKQVAVPVVGDTVDEPDETFTVGLSGAVNATVADPSGVGTIKDDDEVPALAINDVTAAEGSAATFTVSLNRPKSVPVSVHAATANGTATAPGDFAATSVEVMFAPGETSKQVAVQTVGDTVDEPNETFTVVLSGASGATVGDGTGVGTIVDDDRDGGFACTATALGSVTANPAYAPCKDDVKTAASLNVNLGLLRIQSTGPRATTDQTPNTLAGTRPALGDGAVSTAQLGTTRITTLGLTIEIGATTSTASARCVAKPGGGLAPAYSGSSSIGTLKVNGIPIPVGSAPVTIPLLVGTLKLNGTTTTATGVTQRAIELRSLLGNVVVGEARAAVVGNPCVG